MNLLSFLVRAQLFGNYIGQPKTHTQFLKTGAPVPVCNGYITAWTTYRYCYWGYIPADGGYYTCYTDVIHL